MTAARNKEEHAHSLLRAHRDGWRPVEIKVPAGIGLEKAMIEMREGVCYQAIHTHDGSGRLHLEVVPGNNLTLGSFFKSWGKLESLREARVFIDGRKIVDPEAYRLRGDEVVVVRFIALDG